MIDAALGFLKGTRDVSSYYLALAAGSTSIAKGVDFDYKNRNVVTLMTDADIEAAVDAEVFGKLI